MGFRLPQQHRLRDLFSRMHVKQIPLRMYPQPKACGRGYFRKAFHHDELIRLHTLQEFPDVDMRVALRHHLGAVDGQRPL